MIQSTHSVRRAVLLFVAFVTATASLEASALAGERTFWWYTYGAERDDEEFMVTFDVWDPNPPMPHFTLDTSIPALYLEHESSVVIVPPNYYKNTYAGTRDGFVTGKTYQANFYRKEGQNWIHILQGTPWTEP
jgi:hypothetical protein